MSSQRQNFANRRNSSQSTGPRTYEGKERARRNALRHGLAAITMRDPSISAEVDRLSQAIGGLEANPVHREHVLVLAEVEVVLSRLRKVRMAIFEQISTISAARKSGAPGSEAPGVDTLLEQLVRLDRYERRAFSRRKRAVRAMSVGP
jgi:hypothetical protein